MISVDDGQIYLEQMWLVASVHLIKMLIAWLVSPGPPQSPLEVDPGSPRGESSGYLPCLHSSRIFIYHYYYDYDFIPASMVWVLLAGSIYSYILEHVNYLSPVSTRLVRCTFWIFLNTNIGSILYYRFHGSFAPSTYFFLLCLFYLVPGSIDHKFKGNF